MSYRMPTAAEHLDHRYAQPHRLTDPLPRPQRGWIRAVRDALGMTTAQLAQRMGVTQPRISELERGEVTGSITVRSLERAAEALGCRLVYAIVPIAPLTTTLEQRALHLAHDHLEAVEHTMRLEDQSVSSLKQREEALIRLATALRQKPKRLWDER